MYFRAGLIYGVILGVILVTGTQILTWVGLGLTNWFVLLTFIALLVVVFLAVRDLSNKCSGDLSLVKGAGMILLIVIMSRYIFQIYMYTYTQYIDSNWVGDVSAYWADMLETKGTTAIQIETQISAFKKSYEPIQMFTIEVIKYGLPQIVLGLLVLVIYRWRYKKK